ncbi:Chst8 [Symbiodinium natans]|uniref:Chst8 protein n=1 Tax=Symbiodinium natans TaxID=878477 RepID=A0A812M394_9DINO|nr:Chst8 [Symbiodinium natans]
MKTVSIIATLTGVAFGTWSAWKAFAQGWALPRSAAPAALERSNPGCRLDLKGEASGMSQPAAFDSWYANQSDAWLAPFVIPSRRIVFCDVQKAGSSRWLRLLRWLAGSPDWDGNPHFLDSEGHPGGLRRLEHLPREEAVQIMRDPKWTKIAVVRDPLDRLRSAYLDRVVGATEPNEIFEKRLFAHYQSLASMSFSDFLARVELGMHFLENEDVHWQRQSRRCDLGKFLPLYHHVFIIPPDKSARAEVSDCVLEALAKTAPNPAEVRNFSMTSRASESLVAHRTDAESHSTYDEELCLKARQLYAEDYEVFQMQRPTCLATSPHVTWPSLPSL